MGVVQVVAKKTLFPTGWGPQSKSRSVAEHKWFNNGLW